MQGFGLASPNPEHVFCSLLKSEGNEWPCLQGDHSITWNHDGKGLTPGISWTKGESYACLLRSKCLYSMDLLLWKYKTVAPVHMIGHVPPSKASITVDGWRSSTIYKYVMVTWVWSWIGDLIGVNALLPTCDPSLPRPQPIKFSFLKGGYWHSKWQTFTVLIKIYICSVQAEVWSIKASVPGLCQNL